MFVKKTTEGEREEKDLPGPGWYNGEVYWGKVGYVAEFQQTKPITAASMTA